MSNLSKVKLQDVATIQTGKLDSNAAVENGLYPFFTCDPKTLSIDTWAYDTEAVLLAGNNASGNYTAKYYCGKFNAYQRTYIIESKFSDILNTKFLSYAINQQLCLLKSMSAGSTTKFLTMRMLNNLSLFLPSVAYQNRIVSILSAYDDLIENNQKQIKLLEEAAQRLYKEWFVDLRFPGWENTKIVDGVPEGWTVTTLDDVIDFDPKVPLSKDRIKQFVPMSALSTNSMCLNLNEITFTQSNSGSKFQNGDTLLARITPCLENGKTAFVSSIISDEGAVGSTEYIVMRSKKLNPYMVYLLARTNDFRQAAINSMSGSDGRQRAKVDKLKCLPYLLPLDNIIQKSLDLFKPIFFNIESLSIQSQRLDEIKNMLLSKLMNDKAGIL